MLVWEGKFNILLLLFPPLSWLLSPPLASAVVVVETGGGQLRYWISRRCVVMCSRVVRYFGGAFLSVPRIFGIRKLSRKKSRLFSYEIGTKGEFPKHVSLED